MVLAVALVADVSNPTLPLIGGTVSRVSKGPFSREVASGYVNVTGRLFNVSVSSVSMGPYALNQVPASGGSTYYLVQCYEEDSCGIGFSTINDSSIHNYVGSVSSVPIDVRLSDGDVVRGSVAVVENLVSESLPNGLIAQRLMIYESGRLLESNLSAWIPLNDSTLNDSIGPTVQVTIGNQTVNSSYFTRQTVSLPLSNGTEEVLFLHLILHGPVVYYVMENAGRQLPVTLWLEGGGQVNFTRLAESWVYTVLRP